MSEILKPLSDGWSLWHIVDCVQVEYRFILVTQSQKTSCCLSTEVFCLQVIFSTLGLESLEK